MEGDVQMLLLEMPLENNDFDELKKVLSNDSYTIIIPKHIDGQAVIQALIDIAKVSVPALVTYLIGRKSLVNMTWKYNGKVDLEMTAAVNKKELTEQKLSDYFYAQLEKSQSLNIKKENNETDNS